MNEVALAALFAVLVVVLFVLALMEASLLHLRRSAVVADAASGDRSARRLLELLDDLPRVMNAILLAVLLSQVTATAIAGLLAARLSEGGGVTIATVAVTVVLFIYGEAIPKTVAIRRPRHSARRLAPLTRAVRWVLGPVVAVLVWIAEVQSPRSRDLDEHGGVSEDELLHLTGEAAAAGHIEPSDAELIERSFDLGDLRAGEILVPLERVVGTPTTTPVSEALSILIAAGHRRLVVSERSPERVVGFVRIRDLADAATSQPELPVGELVQEALAVGADDLIIEVLRAMQAAGRHLAVVRAASSDVVGILTVEDIVEELVGSIDEPDEN